MLMTILLVVLVLAFIGALPTWGYSSSYGYGPVGVIAIILILALILGHGSIGL